MLKPFNAQTARDMTSADQPQKGQTSIEIYTDGSCIRNPGPGGYGIVTLRLSDGGEILKRREHKGSEPMLTTNIRMEITAACVAIENLGNPTDEPVTLFCDASLIPNAMNNWLTCWKAKGWKKSDRKPVENRDLWERLEEAVEGRNVSFLWLRSHNGSEHNERADQLAYAGARAAGELGLAR